MTVSGRCLCGAVRWESAEPPITTRVCWCRDCRYLGAGSATVGVCFRTTTFKISGRTSDYSSVADSGDRMHRRSCPDCGTPLFSEAEARPHLDSRSVPQCGRWASSLGRVWDPARSGPYHPAWGSDRAILTHLGPQARGARNGEGDRDRGPGAQVHAAKPRSSKASPS
ncbi:MAG: GFA family protein [Burkholderiaceae bacterium]|nr:GFA family protein [Burkholderiaceae bacterium]